MASNNPHYEADPKPKVSGNGSEHIIAARGPTQENANGTELIIGARGLDIVWGNDNRYWRIPFAPKPKNNPAELLQVCWLQVTCSIDISDLESLGIKEAAKIGFTISLSSDAFGWGGCPIYIMAKIGKKGKYSWKKVYIQEAAARGRGEGEGEGGSKQTFEIPNPADSLFMSLRGCPPDEKLYFGLYEVWSGKWKGGLQIHNAFIREHQN